ncbi:MAG: type II secretion system protein GspE, partial [Candidatus Omnitrophota bacterium]
MRLGEILVNEGIISSEALDEALKKQEQTGKFIGEILINRGLASEEKITQALSEQLGFAFVKVEEIPIEHNVLKLISEESARRHKVMPLYISDDTLTVAMVNPLDVKIIDELQAASG